MKFRKLHSSNHIMGEKTITTENQPALVTKHEQILDIIDGVLTNSSALGITKQYTEDESYDGRIITLKGKQLINFGSCSYLGLEMDERLINASIDAVKRYGTQYSSSRAYVSCGLYTELEHLLGKIFNGYVNISHSTTLGHISNIPVFVGDNDAVILDSQVHDSVQTAVQLLKARGVQIDLLRHNRIDILEDRVKELVGKYNKIWYFADGVYSMYGDFAPMEDVTALLNKYDQLNLYIDDAHGMSWCGPRGAGYVASQLTNHPQLFLTTSLAKAFGACGGVMVYNDERTRDRVRNCGGTFIFSGPIQPSVLGSAIESAKIHLTDEIYVKQNLLQDKINYFNRRCRELGLPIINETNSPIFFIGVGQPGTGYNMVKRLLNLGFFINISVFPSVSYNRTGLRIPITLHHTTEDIERLLTAVAEQLPFALADTGLTMADIYKAFKLKK